MHISGNERKNYSQEELDGYIQDHEQTFQQSTTYTKFEIFGKSAVREVIQTEGCKGVKIINLLESDGQTGVYLIPVDCEGNDLGSPVSAKQARRDDPDPVPKCPTACN